MRGSSSRVASTVPARTNSPSLTATEASVPWVGGNTSLFSSAATLPEAVTVTARGSEATVAVLTAGWLDPAVAK